MPLITMSTVRSALAAAGCQMLEGAGAMGCQVEGSGATSAWWSGMLAGHKLGPWGHMVTSTWYPSLCPPLPRHSPAAGAAVRGRRQAAPLPGAVLAAGPARHEPAAHQGPGAGCHPAAALRSLLTSGGRGGRQQHWQQPKQQQWWWQWWGGGCARGTEAADPTWGAGQLCELHPGIWGRGHFGEAMLYVMYATCSMLLNLVVVASGTACAESGLFPPLTNRSPTRWHKWHPASPGQDAHARRCMRWV